MLEGTAFLRHRHGEQPPPGPLLPTAGVTLEVDPHRFVGGRDDLAPMLFHILLGTAVIAFAGLVPGTEHGGYLDGPVPPENKC